MDTQGRDDGKAFFPEVHAQRGACAADVPSYESAEQIASDLKTALLAEFRCESDAGRWEEDLSSLVDSGWVGQCEGLVRRLVQLREASPLDVVAVCALTEGVQMKAFLYSLGVAMRRLLQRVVLMDCDLRAPWPLKAADGSEAEGFIDMVKHGCSFFTVSRETEVSGLYVIGAGSHPVLSEGELVGKDLERTFNSLRTKSDATLARVPPLLPGKRVNPVLACVDAVLVCVSRPAARKPAITEAFTRLWQSDVPILGIVNHEPREFEQRRTVVLDVASHASEPERPPIAGGSPGSARLQAGKSAAAAGSEASRRIELDLTPEWKPLSSASGETSDTGRMFGTASVPGAEGGWTGPGRGGPAGTADTGASAIGRSRSRVRSAEERFLDRELFGRKRLPTRFVFLIGLPVLLAALVAAAVLWPRLDRTRLAQVDSHVMRSILLPGSDGIVGAGGVEKAQVVLPSLPEVRDSSAGALSAGTYYVHVSSHKMYESAMQDSAKVARAGFRVSVQFVNLSELGRWYRVMAGPFHTATAVRAAAARIQPMGLAKQVRIIQQGVGQ